MEGTQPNNVSIMLVLVTRFSISIIGNCSVLVLKFKMEDARIVKNIISFIASVCAYEKLITNQKHSSFVHVQVIQVCPS